MAVMEQLAFRRAWRHRRRWNCSISTSKPIDAGAQGIAYRQLLAISMHAAPIPPRASRHYGVLGREIKSRRRDETARIRPRGVYQLATWIAVHRQATASNCASIFRCGYTAPTGWVPLKHHVTIATISPRWWIPCSQQRRHGEYRGEDARGRSGRRDVAGRGYEYRWASYCFTRLAKHPRRDTSASEGFYFKIEMIRRMDAISYDHDAFGKVIGGYVEEHRHSTVDAWKKIIPGAATRRSSKTR